MDVDHANGTLEILDPTTEPRVVPRPLAPRPESLAGRPIGFLSNKKANADALLREVEARLRAQLPHFEAVHAFKSAPLPAPEEVLARLSRCAAVVSAVAD